MPASDQSQELPRANDEMPAKASGERFESESPVQALRSLYFQAQLDVDRATALRSHVATGYGIAITIILVCGLIAAAFAASAFPMPSDRGEALRSMPLFVNFSLTVLATFAAILFATGVCDAMRRSVDTEIKNKLNFLKELFNRDLEKNQYLRNLFPSAREAGLTKYLSAEFLETMEEIQKEIGRESDG